MEKMFLILSLTEKASYNEAMRQNVSEFQSSIRTLMIFVAIAFTAIAISKIVESLSNRKAKEIESQAKKLEAESRAKSDEDRAKAEFIAQLLRLSSEYKGALNRAAFGKLSSEEAVSKVDEIDKTTLDLVGKLGIDVETLISDLQKDANK